MLLTYHPYMRLQFDPALRLLRMQLTPLPWQSDEFRKATLALLQAAEDMDARLCLLDLASTHRVSVSDQLWMSVHWSPWAVRLPLQRVVYHFGPQQPYNQLAVESLLYLAGPLVRFDAQFFSDISSGLGWLTNDSPHLPALLAEWQTASPWAEAIALLPPDPHLASRSRAAG